MSAPRIDPATLNQRAWLEIDHDAIAANVAILTRLADGSRVAPVVKADAYGHGIEAVTRTLAAAGVAAACIATVDEAFLLREAGIELPLLLLYPPPPDALDELARLAVEPAVSTPAGVAAVAAWGRRRGPGDPVLRVHLEIETGLTRMGVLPTEAGPAAAALAAAGGTVLAGLWSHIADPADPAGIARQVAALGAAEASLRAAGVAVPVRHLAASGGLIAGGVPPLELIRPGIAVYGVLPDGLTPAADRAAAAAALRPALSLRARPIRILEVPPGTPVSYGGRWVAQRTSRIATVPLGYGDGYSRTTGPGAEVLIHGRRAPIVGSIAMDALMVDVTAIPEAGIDDEIVLLGAQGAERIGAGELAERRGTIPWEVLATLSRRLPRIHRHPAGDGVRTLAGDRPAADA